MGSDTGGIACPSMTTTVAGSVSEMDKSVVTFEGNTPAKGIWLALSEGNRRVNVSNYDEMFLHCITRVHTLYPSLFSVGTLIDL